MLVELNEELAETYEYVHSLEAHKRWLNDELLIYLDDDGEPHKVTSFEDYKNHDVFVDIKAEEIF